MSETVITIDLDDTLLHTQHHYTEARENFAEFVSQNFGVDKGTARQKQSDYSRELLDEYGLKPVRFQLAMEEALIDLANGNHTPSDITKAREFGENAFKSEEEYKSKGLADGSLELLNTAESLADQVWILTAGHPPLQNRKVDAVGLRSYVDAVRIVGMDGKESVLSSASDTFETVAHIGNSSSSDVEAAENADVDCIHIPTANWRNTTDISYSSPSGSFEQVKSLQDAALSLSDMIQTN
jgi:FMN phosphatase YigB (HAD superfamily)